MDLLYSPGKIIFSFLGLFLFVLIMSVVAAFFFPRLYDSQKKNELDKWFREHWKWLAVCAVFMAVIFVHYVNNYMKQSEIYRQSSAMLSQSAALKDSLGDPVVPGYFVSGRVSAHGSSRIEYSVSGPRGRGRLYAEGIMSGDVFMFEYVYVKPVSGKYIWLVEEQYKLKP